MLEKYNFILHITTSCNFRCSYCDVIKDNKKIENRVIEDVISFINSNYNKINRFKFFGGEPLLAFESIKKIINHTNDKLGNKYEIVTNTSLLNDEIGLFFSKYFEIIFFSIDIENKFNYDYVKNIILKYNLSNKVFFNLVISPGTEYESYNQFKKLLSMGFTNFNILPVYFTKEWTDLNLINLSKIMKNILDESINNSEINLYGFQQNSGYNNSLINESLFIDIDGIIYYSDFISTYIGSKLKEKLVMGKIKDFIFDNLLEKDFYQYKKYINIVENDNGNKIKGQKKLHKIMDYFSVYLNKKLFL